MTEYLLTGGREIQRITIDRPLSLTPYDGIPAPHPHHMDGTPIQVNLYYDENGCVVERWLLSETDERFYRLEKWDKAWVSVKIEKRKPVEHP